MSLREWSFGRAGGALRRLARSVAAGLVTLPLAAHVAAQPLAGDGSVVCGTSYDIAPGDTLSRVADRAYGDPMLYRVLVETNRDAIGNDPARIAVGMSITIPCVDASGEILSAGEAAKASASIEAAVAAEGPLTPGELDALFGPVALFPDPVLTPVLVAATFPLDVVKAGRFVAGAEDLPATDRAAKAADQSWDESVRELAAAFPDLVTRMSDNIDWTEQAGEAVVAQTDEVLASIQRLRVKARENGYLVDNEAQKVEEINEKIVIAPASPGVVHVPTYDSQVVYTTPVVGAPVYHYGYGYDHVYHDDDDWDDALVAGGIILGGAVILDEIFDDDDWDGWDSDDDIDWDRGDITIDRDDVDIDIDRGDLSIGDGDRPRIGDGERVSIGDSDRPQIERGDRGIGERTGERTGDRPASRKPIADTASRDVARKKIETRKSGGGVPADFGISRPAPPDLARSRAGKPAGKPAPAISRPKASRPATARAPSRSSAFQQPSRSRPSASAHRSRPSAGRGGGGRGGGGRRR